MLRTVPNAVHPVDSVISSIHEKFMMSDKHPA
jgi:hypothetical protein